jgi:uncharacterized protein (TIGR03435 family)
VHKGAERMNRLAIPMALLAASCIAQAQQTTKLEFEVASIKPSPQPAGGARVVMGCRGGPGTKDPSLLVCENINLTSLVGMAYDVPYYATSEPDWLLVAHFDVRAVVPEGATKDQFAIMLQNLLAERFKLALHHEARDIRRYELTVAKGGPKFKESAPPPPSDDSKAGAAPGGSPRRDQNGYPILRSGMGMAIMGDKARLHWSQMTMGLLANQLSGQLGGPVADATDLAGKYDIDLYWVATSDLRAGAPGADPAGLAGDPGGPTLEQALQEQLGLKLESKKGAVDFLMVDHIEKLPTEN